MRRKSDILPPHLLYIVITFVFLFILSPDEGAALQTCELSQIWHNFGRTLNMVFLSISYILYNMWYMRYVRNFIHSETIYSIGCHILWTRVSRKNLDLGLWTRNTRSRWTMASSKHCQSEWIECQSENVNWSTRFMDLLTFRLTSADIIPNEEK